jgi:hypothetical protein
MTDRNFRPKSAVAMLLAAMLAVTGVACGSFTGVPSSLDTLADSGTVYAINGAPPSAPTSLYLFAGTLVSADANFLFDVAFDIDSLGRIVVLPQRAVASGLATTHTVAIQAVSGSYDALNEAPKSGYRADTALVVTTNQVVMIQSQDANACSTSLTGATALYGKIVIDSVDPVTREMSIRFTTDPNCGFFSFAVGLPPN